MPQWQPGSKDRMQISGMLHSIPVFGQAISLIDALTGKDWVGGTKLSMGQWLFEGGLAALPTLGHLAEGAVTGVEAAVTETRAARGFSSLKSIAPMTQAQGVEAEAAFREWLEFGRGLKLAPKSGAFSKGADAVVVGAEDLGWRFAELKPDRFWSLRKGASQVRKRLRSGMDGPGSLYGYRSDGEGGWLFRFIKSWP